MFVVLLIDRFLGVRCDSGIPNEATFLPNRDKHRARSDWVDPLNRTASAMSMKDRLSNRSGQSTWKL